jgi:hypothetical protein
MIELDEAAFRARIVEWLVSNSKATVIPVDDGAGTYHIGLDIPAQYRIEAEINRLYAEMTAEVIADE